MSWTALAALALLGCEKKPEATVAVNPSEPEEAEVPMKQLIAPPAPQHARYLALGDSYTIGQSVEPAERYPNQLVAALRKQGLDVPDAAILARTGWTAAELMSAIDGETFEPSYDLVTVLIGVNDQYRGGTPEAFAPELKRVLDRATAFAGGKADHVVVLSIPDWGVMPFNTRGPEAGVSEKIDAFNAVCRLAAEARGMHFVDITPISREVVNDGRLGAADLLHPSGEQYRRWAELLGPVTLRLLREK